MGRPCSYETWGKKITHLFQDWKSVLFVVFFFSSTIWRYLEWKFVVNRSLFFFFPIKKKKVVNLFSLAFKNMKALIDQDDKPKGIALMILSDLQNQELKRRQFLPPHWQQTHLGQGKWKTWGQSLALVALQTVLHAWCHFLIPSHAHWHYFLCVQAQRCVPAGTSNCCYSWAMTNSLCKHKNVISHGLKDKLGGTKRKKTAEPKDAHLR